MTTVGTDHQDGLDYSAAQTNTNYCKTPPAGKNAVDGLLHLRLRALDKDHEMCLICSEQYEIGCVVTSLPCGHMYHSSCIIDWLQRKCTCPMCRYELPTDDPNFEPGRVRRMKDRTTDTSSSLNDDDDSEMDILSVLREKVLQKENLKVVAMALRYTENLQYKDDDDDDTISNSSFTSLEEEDSIF